MEPTQILQYAIAVLDAVPKLVQAGVDVAAVVQAQKAKIEEMVEAKRDPTIEEWEALDAQIEALRSRLHKA